MPQFSCTGGESDSAVLVFDDHLSIGDEVTIPVVDQPGWVEVYAVSDDARLEFVTRRRAIYQHVMDCETAGARSFRAL